MNPAHARLMRYFAYDHLPPHLQERSKRFRDLAVEIIEDTGWRDDAEVTVALRKLLEAKDAAVRACL